MLHMGVTWLRHCQVAEVTAQLCSSVFVSQVFEKLGLSLYDFLRVNQYRPFRIDVVRAFGRQLLESVAYLHGLDLIHTDLKPENILLAACDDDRKSPTPGIRSAMLPPSLLAFCPPPTPSSSPPAFSSLVPC